MKNLGFYIALLLLLSSAFTSWQYKREKEERKRLQGNQAALMEGIRRYKTKDSLNVVSIQALTLTKKEFEQHNTELANRVKDLGIKVKRLESVTSTGTTTTTYIKGEVRDSLIYVDREREMPDMMKCLKYISPYLMVDACVYKGEFTGLVVSKDTLDQFVHRVPRIEFLFVRIGTKGISQEIYSRNPHSEIHYSKYIKFK